MEEQVILNWPEACRSLPFDKLSSMIQAAEVGILSKCCSNGCNAFFYAVQRKNEKEAIRLVQLIFTASGGAVSPCHTDNISQTALFYAARDGRLRCVHYLVTRHAVPVSHVDIYGQTALFYAAREGRSEIARFLVENGCNVNTVDKLRQETALFYAAAQGHKSIIDLLISRLGADPKIRNCDGRTAAEIARGCGNKSIEAFINGLVANRSHLNVGQKTCSKTDDIVEGAVKGSPVQSSGKELMEHLMDDRASDDSKRKYQNDNGDSCRINFPDNPNESKIAKTDASNFFLNKQTSGIQKCLNENSNGLKSSSESRNFTTDDIDTGTNLNKINDSKNCVVDITNQQKSIDTSLVDEYSLPNSGNKTISYDSSETLQKGDYYPGDSINESHQFTNLVSSPDSDFSQTNVPSPQCSFEKEESYYTDSKSNQPACSSESLTDAFGAASKTQGCKRRRYRLQYLSPDSQWLFPTALKIKEFECRFPSLCVWNKAQLFKIKPSSDPFKARWHKIATELIAEISRYEGVEHFMEPVDVQKWNINNYYDVIRKPMDLGTVRLNLRNNSYHTIHQFLADVYLVFSNCLKFNGRESQFGMIAHNLQQYFNNLIAQKGLDVLYNQETAVHLQALQVIRDLNGELSPEEKEAMSADIEDCVAASLNETIK